MTCDTINQTFNNIIHHTIQYVDDSSNIIGAKNHIELEQYIQKYFKILEAFYNINKLRINPDKSKFMVVCKPKYRKITNNMVLVTNNYTIKQEPKIKILGTFLTSGLTNTATLNLMVSKINYRLAVLSYS